MALAKALPKPQPNRQSESKGAWLYQKHYTLGLMLLHSMHVDPSDKTIPRALPLYPPAQ